MQIYINIININLDVIQYIEYAKETVSLVY
jgi:hypothetical protein